jgi:hypothetical protein
MDKETEIASGFKVGRYEQIRAALDIKDARTSEWQEVLSAFQRRIRERFLWPIRELARHDKRERDERPTRAGFSILALDCLLIDTIQSFREGRISTGEISPAASFKSFLNTPRFLDFNSKDREEFFQYVRNALLHNGETRKDWKIQISSDGLLFKDKNTKTRTINRRLFHCGVLREFRILCRELESSTKVRQGFLRRMDALCGLNVEPLRNLYFAYGSNLLESEIKRDAKDAEAVGKAFLPCYRLEFTKHADSWGADAANIREHEAGTVWGFVYKLHDEDRKRLSKRENRYREIELTIFLKNGEDITPVDVFTFQGKEGCAKHCGPSAEYLAVVIEGAKSRHLPLEYIDAIPEKTGRGG